MEPLISKTALYSASISNPKTLISNYIFNGLATLGSSFPFNLNKNFTHNQICLHSCHRSTVPSSFTLHCKGNGRGEYPLSLSSAYEILGVSPYCTFAELKSAFRSKVKQYHPDVSKDVDNSDDMIRQVITAYEIISKNPGFNNIDRDELSDVDPFDEPECEALDIFINETLCIGKGCPSSCVKAVPSAFSFDSWTGTARATVQGFRLLLAGARENVSITLRHHSELFWRNYLAVFWSHRWVQRLKRISCILSLLKPSLRTVDIRNQRRRVAFKIGNENNQSLQTSLLSKQYNTYLCKITKTVYPVT
ncbi:uncharacterized protein LOC113336922 isoform X1 [Papaver somniferum]|uniref:uncharacterized protein LOC113336922 isoform X1 n=1 Tax=Papaver somniferum TaxID=3469 RepID=UPI000E6FDC74|nr:uncharacterized protein LOC113336922 isoform X1 [Papaver somniferum]